jgi:hypothetical protein
MSAATAPAKSKEKKVKTDDEKKRDSEAKAKLAEYRNEVHVKFNKTTGLLVGLPIIESNFDSGDFIKLLTKVVTHNVMSYVNQIHETEKLSSEVDLYKPSEYTIIPEKKPSKPKKSVKDVATAVVSPKITLNIDDENGDEAKNTEAGDEEVDADEGADDDADDGADDGDGDGNADADEGADDTTEEKKDSGKKGKKNVVGLTVHGRAYLCFLFSRIFREIYSINKRIHTTDENVTDKTIYGVIIGEKYNKAYGDYRVFKHMQTVNKHINVNLESDQGLPDWIQKHLSVVEGEKVNATLMNYSIGVIKNYLALMCKIISRKILSQRVKITDAVIENAMRDIDLLLEINNHESYINFSKLISDLRGIVKEITHNPYAKKEKSAKKSDENSNKEEAPSKKEEVPSKKENEEETEETVEEEPKKKPTKPAATVKKLTQPAADDAPAKPAPAKKVKDMKK